MLRRALLLTQLFESKMKKRNIAILSVICILAAIVGLLLFPVLQSSRLSWPNIADSAGLLVEADLLCKATPLGEIPRENWPTGVAALKPQHVTTTEGHLYITISGGGINPAHGYLIFPDGRAEGSADPGLRVSGTVAPGIFKFETVE